MDGRTVEGRIRQSAGGVGRNIADALGKLQRCPPLLLSAIGSDLYGKFLLDNINHLVSIQSSTIHRITIIISASHLSS